MNQNIQNPNSANPLNQASERTSSEAEQTLRLLAELPPPSELTDRVHRRLSHAQASLPRRRFWALWMPAQRLQFVGAALLVVVFAGSTWGVYHAKDGHAKGTQGALPAPQNTASPVSPASPISPASPGAGGFGSAGTERRPSTLTPIKVPPASKKKPSASHAATKRTPNPDATQSAIKSPTAN
jgi:hypothetical protein